MLIGLEIPTINSNLEGKATRILDRKCQAVLEWWKDNLMMLMTKCMINIYVTMYILIFRVVLNSFIHIYVSGFFICCAICVYML